MISKSEFRNQLFFLFLFTLVLGVELGGFSKNLSGTNSIMSEKSILFSESIYEIIRNVLIFSIPVIIFLAALNQKNTSMKIIYIAGAMSLVLSPSVINKIGFNGLSFIKVISLFVVVIFLMRYLAKAYEEFIHNFRTQEGGADNQRLQVTPQSTRRS